MRHHLLYKPCVQSWGARRRSKVLETPSVSRTPYSEVIRLTTSRGLNYSILDGHEATDIGIPIEKEAQVGNHHFLPALKSLVHPAARIGIVLVARGIIVMKLEVQAAALRQLQRYSVR